MPLRTSAMAAAPLASADPISPAARRLLIAAIPRPMPAEQLLPDLDVPEVLVVSCGRAVQLFFGGLRLNHKPGQRDQCKRTLAGEPDMPVSLAVLAANSEVSRALELVARFRGRNRPARAAVIHGRR